MKNPMNFFSNENSLYRMERKVISGVLLCFIVSGIFLPTAKAHLPKEAPAEDPALESSLPKEDPKTSNSSKKTAKTKNSILQDTVTEIVEIWNEAKLAKLEEETETAEDAADAEDTETPENTADTGDSVNNSAAVTPKKNTVADSSHSGGSPSQSAPSAPSGDTSSSSSPPPASTPTPVEQPKVWVPPVYKTVHHDAIYETRRSVVCNYCGAAFGSAGEFQVHKDANGG